jgi:hypothetical protein
VKGATSIAENRAVRHPRHSVWALLILVALVACAFELFRAGVPSVPALLAYATAAAFWSAAFASVVFNLSDS